MTEQNRPNLQYSGVTLQKRLNPKFLFTPNTLWKCQGVPNKEKSAPFHAVHHFWQRGWLCCNTYVLWLLPCGSPCPEDASPCPPSDCSDSPRHTSFQGKIQLSNSRPVLSNSPHTECLRKLQKEKNKPPIELLAIGDLNGLDINPTRTSGSNRLPWMLDWIQLKSFHEIN